MMEAIVPSGEATMEMQLSAAGVNTIVTAKSMRVTTNEEYDTAAEFLRKIKDRAKQVKDYWNPAKTKAKAAHQDIVDREKAMLAPLTDAEKIVKAEMVRYQAAVEAARRKAAEEEERRKREEAERLLAAAAEAEESGDEMGSAINLAMAEMVEDMPAISASPTAAPKAAGIGVRKTWKARVIDDSLVPVAACGAVIRPVDMSALNQIAKLTKGTAQIPGVEFFEDSSISVRA